MTFEEIAEALHNDEKLEIYVENSDYWESSGLTKQDTIATVYYWYNQEYKFRIKPKVKYKPINTLEELCEYIVSNQHKIQVQTTNGWGDSAYNNYYRDHDSEKLLNNWTKYSYRVEIEN